MSRSSVRYGTPIHVPRPRGARLLHGFSVKLGRPVQFHSSLSFEHWIRLEADPFAVTFCEHPVKISLDGSSRVIDFWVQYAHHEELQLVAPGELDPTLPKLENGLALRQIPGAERAALSMWVSNWQQMLPVLVSCRSLVPAALLSSIRNHVQSPLALLDIERFFAGSDPPLVRAAAFELLRTGKLLAPALVVEPLSLNTVIEPS